MTYEQLIQIVTSYPDPKHWLNDDEKGVFTLKEDLDVRLLEDRSIWEERMPFPEPWSKEYPDPKAYPARFELWYRASFVKDYHFVSVDGARALIPLPHQKDLSITVEQAAIASIVNGDGIRDYFNRYIQRFPIRYE
jgi:hypothetical protein